MARLGHMPPEQVHRYEAEALIDTGATRCVLPPFVAARLGLVPLTQTDARYADGRLEVVDVCEPFAVEILGAKWVAAQIDRSETWLSYILNRQRLMSDKIARGLQEKLKIPFNDLPKAKQTTRRRRTSTQEPA
jgi:predicted aspartyl protease